MFKIKYYQSLTLEEKEYIQNELDKIDYFFKEELSKKDFKTLDYISKQSSVGDYEFLISINNNSGFINKSQENSSLYLGWWWIGTVLNNIKYGVIYSEGGENQCI